MERGRSRGPIHLKAHAKLNLILDVLGRRADGYHQIDTFFERISLADRLTFHPAAGSRLRLECRDPQVPLGPENLILRAGRLLQEEHGVREGARILLWKRIPVAAGLGGGSSDAAAALIGLNRLWGLGLSAEALMPYGRRLGSDVPFFLSGASWARGTERGDRIEALDLPGCLWHVLVAPCVTVRSADVYAALARTGPRRAERPFPDGALKLTKKRDDVNMLIYRIIRKDGAEIDRLRRNDLESAILRVRPALAAVRARMEDLVDGAVRFSGSGPTLFTVARSEKEAREEARRLRRRYRRVFVVRTA